VQDEIVSSCLRRKIAESFEIPFCRALRGAAAQAAQHLVLDERHEFIGALVLVSGARRPRRSMSSSLR
jgi:hypothetical protein